MPRSDADPTFLDRRSYRRRRFRDLARVLPILGAVLIALPLLWPRSVPDAALTSQALIYLFVVWIGLIVAAFGLTSRVWDGAEDGDSPGDDP